MKKLLLAFLLVAGCSSGGGGQNESMSENDFETGVATVLAFDPTLLKNGDKVTYLVKRTGEASQRYSWSVVSEDRSGLWIENNMPFNEGRMVVKTKLDRSGKVLERWIGEPGGIPGRTYPPPTGAAGEQPKPVRDSSAAAADTKEEPDRIVIAGQSYDCTRVTTVLTYPRDRRKSTMINWFSRDVPFPASKPLGGLVKRQFGRLTMELIKVDKDARPEMLIPPKER